MDRLEEYQLEATLQRRHGLSPRTKRSLHPGTLAVRTHHLCRINVEQDLSDLDRHLAETAAAREDSSTFNEVYYQRYDAPPWPRSDAKPYTRGLTLHTAGLP